MSDITEGETDGRYTVTVASSAMEADEGKWNWTGYARSSTDALSQALDERGNLFRWRNHRWERA